MAQQTTRCQSLLSRQEVSAASLRAIFIWEMKYNEFNKRVLCVSWYYLSKVYEGILQIKLFQQDQEPGSGFIAISTDNDTLKFLVTMIKMIKIVTFQSFRRFHLDHQCSKNKMKVVTDVDFYNFLLFRKMNLM